MLTVFGNAVLAMTITQHGAMSIQIRKIAPSDHDAVLAINEACVPHVNSIGDEQLRWFTEHASFANVACIDDRVAGFLIGMRPGTSYASPNYRWFCSNYDDFAYVDRVAVAEWAQRRGIGVLLYEAFAESDRTAGRMTCEVNIRPANDGSMRFHEQLGFECVATQETENGTKEVALLVKPL